MTQPFIDDIKSTKLPSFLSALQQLFDETLTDTTNISSLIRFLSIYELPVTVLYAWDEKYDFDLYDDSVFHNYLADFLDLSLDEVIDLGTR